MLRADAKGIARRPAFTLVEILVVLTIIIVLSGITIAFLTGYNGPASSARGATMVQQTLTIARTEALRGRRPYGVRLIPDPSNTSNIIQMQFIEQPDDFFGGRVQTPTPKVTKPATPQQLDQVQFLDVDLFGGFGANASTKWPVQPGDYIEFRGTGLVRRILNIYTPANPPNPKPANFTYGMLIQLQSPLPYALPTQGATPPSGVPNQFRIIRAPRVVGEEPVSLPDDIAIDISTNAAYLNTLPTTLDMQAAAVTYHDILFSPSGAVIGRGTTETPIFLWVRNVTIAGIANGDPTIIAIYPRTGSTAAHPVCTLGVLPNGNPSNPYQYATDGLSSGL